MQFRHYEWLWSTVTLKTQASHDLTLYVHHDQSLASASGETGPWLI
jgi:hypothetical protein